MRTIKVILTNVARALLAATFIVAAFVKGVDPHGTQYKIVDYLHAMGLATLPSWLSLTMAVLLVAVEFCLGIMLLLAAKRRTATVSTLIFMVLMTAISIWSYVANPVEHCGCFGDAFILSNGQTLAKNIVLLGAAGIVVVWHDKMLRFISDGNSSIVLTYSILFIIGTALYSLYFLPPFDFRPYRIGTDLAAATTRSPDDYAITFIMEKDGKRQAFTLADYPDSTWTFVERTTERGETAPAPALATLSITASDGTEQRDSILQHAGYTFLLVAPSLAHADSSNFGTIALIHEYALTYGYPFYCLTASGARAIAHWQDITGADYPFFFCDDDILKTMIRSNPGLLLLRDGVIIQKWSNNNLPKDERLTAPLTELPIGQEKKQDTIKTVVCFLLIFIVPILLLTTADRLWALRQYLRRRRKREMAPTDTATAAPAEQ